VLGCVAGGFLGLFVAFDLFVLGVIASDSGLWVLLPAALALAGTGLGVWAPLRWPRRS